MRGSYETFQNDTSPSIGYQLPVGVNIAAASVVFSMRPRSSATPVIDRGVARIVTLDPPVVAYDWAAGDTAVMGFYLAEFEVTYADGAVETFRDPAEGIPVTILQEIG